MQLSCLRRILTDRKYRFWHQALYLMEETNERALPPPFLFPLSSLYTNRLRKNYIIKGNLVYDRAKTFLCIKISPSICIHFVFKYLFSNKYEIFVFDLLPYFVNCLTLHYISYYIWCARIYAIYFFIIHMLARCETFFLNWNKPVY